MPLSSATRAAQPSAFSRHKLKRLLSSVLSPVPLLRPKTPSQQVGSYPVEVGREACTVDHVDSGSPSSMGGTGPSSQGSCAQSVIGGGSPTDQTACSLSATPKQPGLLIYHALGLEFICPNPLSETSTNNFVFLGPASFHGRE